MPVAFVDLRVPLKLPVTLVGLTLVQEVDALLVQACAAGATPVKPAQKTFWGGYSAYFADPDGFLWEIAHNPHFWIE